MKTTGQVIRGERCAAGMSAQELASKVGVHAQTVYNWEHDRALPSLDKAVKVSMVLGINPMRLLEGGAANVRATSDA